ncbi:MAG: translation factor SUA5, partial [Clostridia bacterium]|nr:translation factor SUA5 [Clostridia bacterium]
LRPGGITPEELGEFARVTLSAAVLDKLKEGDRVQSPGMKYKHYAPKTPLYLLKGDREDRLRFFSGESERFAVLAYTEEVASLAALPSSPVVFDLGKETDPGEQLHRLFFLLREADKAGCQRIYAALPRTDGLSLALYNRMIRAAAYQIVPVN